MKACQQVVWQPCQLQWQVPRVCQSCILLISPKAVLAWLAAAALRSRLKCDTFRSATSHWGVWSLQGIYSQKFFILDIIVWGSCFLCSSTAFSSLPQRLVYMIIYVYVRFPWFPFTCEISQEKRPWVARFRWQADGKLPRPLAWKKTIQVGAENFENAKKRFKLHWVGIQLRMIRLVVSDHDMILSRSYPGWW